MAITLGDARSVAADLAHDASDAKADRVFMRWIRGALTTLHAAHDWKHYEAQQLLVTDAAETGSDLNVTEGSGTITRDTDWASKYVSQAWDLLIEGDQSLAFTIAAISSPATTATLATNQVWLQDTATDLDYTLTRYRYDLPGNFVRQVKRVDDLVAQVPLEYWTTDQFDLVRNRQPWHQSDQAVAYTVRGPYLELYPSPSTTRRPFRVTYLRQVTLPADADNNGTELDWPTQYADLLWRAIALEGAAWADATRIPYVVAERRYEQALKATKVRDATVVDRSRQLTLTLPGELDIGRFYRNPTTNGLTEQD